jgi:hypothetical protein
MKPRQLIGDGADGGTNMKSKLAICVLVVLSASTIIASAQGPTGGGKGAVGAAAIPGAEVRVREGRRSNAEGTTTGYAMMRRERRTVRQPEPVTVNPYINFDATKPLG